MRPGSPWRHTLWAAVNPKSWRCSPHSRRAEEWDQGEPFVGQLINSCPVTFHFPFGRVSFVVYLALQNGAFLLACWSCLAKQDTSASSGPSRGLHFPFWVMKWISLEWNVPGVFKLTAMASRITSLFQRQKKRKKSRQYSLRGSDDEKLSWTHSQEEVWKVFTWRELKGSGTPASVAQSSLSDQLEDFVFRVQYHDLPSEQTMCSSQTFQRVWGFPGKLAHSGFALCPILARQF